MYTTNNNNNDIRSVVPQVGSTENGVYADYVVFNRPLTQVKHLKAV